MATTAPRNVLGLDVGERRIGVALASLVARIPSPLLTIDRDKNPDAFNTIKKLVAEHDVQILVVGLPRGLEGQETDQTRATREFVDEMKKHLDIEVKLQDEAGTSVLAEQELVARKKLFEKADIDKLAAAYILQDWLSGATVEQL